MIIELQCLDISHLPNPIGLVPKPLHIGMASRAKVLNGTIKTKALEFFKVSFTNKCYKWQGYRYYLAVSCPSHVRITMIDRISIEAIEPDSNVYIF